MKKAFLFFLLTVIFTAFFGMTAYATATIDASNVSKGIVVIKLSGTEGKTIKAQVEKGEEKYLYTLIKNSVNLPLQMGTGSYKISVLENVAGDKYKPLVSETVNAAAIDENALFTASVPIVEYSVSTQAIPAYKALAAGKSKVAEIVSAVYSDVVTNYNYDTAKAASVQAGYVPVIDNVYAAKKGICYDYAAILGGALRSMGIPTKLMMGYVPEISEYHAWNEIMIDGKWVAVDTTYDSQLAKAGHDYSMEKDKSKRKVVKMY